MGIVHSDGGLLWRVSLGTFQNLSPVQRMLPYLSCGYRGLEIAQLPSSSWRPGKAGGEVPGRDQGQGYGFQSQCQGLRPGAGSRRASPSQLCSQAVRERKPNLSSLLCSVRALSGVRKPTVLRGAACFAQPTSPIPNPFWKHAPHTYTHRNDVQPGIWASMAQSG